MRYIDTLGVIDSSFLDGRELQQQGVQRPSQEWKSASDRWDYRWMGTTVIHRTLVSSIEYHLACGSKAASKQVSWRPVL